MLIEPDYLKVFLWKGTDWKAEDKSGKWEGDKAYRGDFLILSETGQQRRTAWACQSKQPMGSTVFTAVRWKGNKCLPVYVLWCLRDLDSDIWHSRCLYVSSGMNRQPEEAPNVRARLQILRRGRLTAANKKKKWWTGRNGSVMCFQIITGEGILRRSEVSYNLNANNSPTPPPEKQGCTQHSSCKPHRGLRAKLLSTAHCLGSHWHGPDAPERSGHRAIISCWED